MEEIWKWVASPLASIIVGCLFLLILIIKNRSHPAKKIDQGAAAVMLLQGAALYTMLTCVVGHWVFKIPVSQTISHGFGDERFAWLMLGLSLDVAFRIYTSLDP